jgi:hypothetical protein
MMNMVCHFVIGNNQTLKGFLLSKCEFTGMVPVIWLANISDMLNQGVRKVLQTVQEALCAGGYKVLQVRDGCTSV